uniref:Uncharacterized protein n=1 Tax=Pithovirus LCPAC403 TaxID=2506596 RepID=A0A481ZFB3_9VIRU|nr:MAG: uncharacterized protein LCPAC403_03250 [Pithovirus LCPAC403]
MDLSQVIQSLETISLQTDNNVLRWSITFSCINDDNCITTEYSVTQNFEKEPPEGDSIHDPNLTKQILDKDLDVMVIDRSYYFLSRERFERDRRTFNIYLETLLK